MIKRNTLSLKKFSINLEKNIFNNEMGYKFLTIFKKWNMEMYVVCAIDTEGPIVNPKKPDILQNWSQVNKLINNIISKI